MSDTIEGALNSWRGVSTEFLSIVEELTLAQWQTVCNAEGWPVGVTAHHVADGYNNAIAWIGSIINNKPIILTADAIHAANAHHAISAADCTKAEVLDLLKERSAALEKLVLGLTIDQQNRAVPMALLDGSPVNPQFVIEILLLSHTKGHLKSIQQALSSIAFK